MSRAAALAAACLPLLAACDSLAVRTTGTPTPLFRVEDPSYAGRGRDFHVVALDDGKTLGGHDALQGALIKGLQDNVRFTTRFTAAPQTHNTDYRIVLIVNPASTVQSRDLCRLPLPPLAFSSGGETHLQGAFCRVSDVLTEADAYASGIGAAGDSRFAAMMSAFMRELLPSRDLRLEQTPE